ncbi:UDP-N-acetylmuramoyl-tripeptide--D-alanyl-D-alanine ligase [Millionella massiliensis]|uniref:UDP-N-acetylmuramoyl-tripeptide--D-alanyl-D- alanine ligase n=1 Tax=Millionella massiliensis TaxID=1871023 RepID=UPI0023A807EE|nr:UDP-N-acetylmuramoyl-tripeptide--D-alanyl-D-alanine ligase [Millionella massiliensis]
MSNTVLGKSLSRLYELYCENGGRVTTDSRSVAAQSAEHDGVGPIFFALQGENFDGNDYARQAVADGAVAAVVHGKMPRGVAADSEEAHRYIVVKDTLAALQELAAHHRDMLGLPVIALTGSNGKTTTKELMARVLRTRYRVACTKGNLNNHIGVPLTLLSVSDQDDVAIVEMGANHPGEIAALCAIARPDIGLVTNVGRAHLEGFGGPEGVRRGKGELFDYLAVHGGTAIYRSDDATLASMIAERFGEDSSAVAVGYTVAELGVSAAAGTHDDRLVIVADGAGEMATGMTGAYNLYNAAAALAVGRYFGIEPVDALRAVAGYEPDNNRSQVELSANATGNTLYKDAYNANPSSMAAALDNFFGLPVAGRRVVVLGDMRELGDFSEAEHRAVVERLSLQPDLDVYLVGPEFTKAAGETCPGHVQVFESSAALADALKRGEVTIRDAHVLVKGSRGIALETLYPLL